MIVLPGRAGAPVQWVVAPPTTPEVPPGLDYMTQVDLLLVRVQVEKYRSECTTVVFVIIA